MHSKSKALFLLFSKDIQLKIEITKASFSLMSQEDNFDWFDSKLPISSTNYHDTTNGVDW